MHGYCKEKLHVDLPWELKRDKWTQREIKGSQNACEASWEAKGLETNHITNWEAKGLETNHTTS